MKTVRGYINSIKPVHIAEPQSPEVNLALIIPAYNEENYIKNILQSLNNQTYTNFEVIIVDNGSTDRTIEIIKNETKDLNYPLHLMIETQPGPGNARKMGMDEASYRFYLKDKNLSKQSFIIVTTDADATPLPTWLADINKCFINECIGGIASTHIGSKEINDTLEKRLGFKEYFNDAHKLISFLADKNIGKLKMSGPNCSFSAKAYCIAGGMEQPYVKNKIGLKEAKHLQGKIEKSGFIVKHTHSPIITSQRRHLYELINGGSHSQYFSQDDNVRFISIRDKEEELLEKAIREVPKEIWENYRKQIVRSVIRNTIVNPLNSGDLKVEELNRILEHFPNTMSGESLVDALISPICEKADIH